MSSLDQYGLEVSCKSTAFESWMTGFDTSFTFDSSGIEDLINAVNVDPNFALAHAPLGRQQLIHGYLEDGQRSISRAFSLTSSITEREASQINVLSAVTRYIPAALSMALKHIERWPLDIFVLALIVGPFGLLAFSSSSNWRNESLDLLKRNRRYYPENDWWYLTTLAFALAESGELSESETLAARAWEINPTGNCAHSLSHVHFEIGAFETGRSFLNEWMETYGQKSDMRHHLQWHTSLIDFEEGTVTPSLVMSRYQKELDPKISDPMPLTTFSDNASFLWRCKLHNIPFPEEFTLDTSIYSHKTFPNVGFAFADIHKIIVMALQNSPEPTQHLTSAFQQLESTETSLFFTALCKGFLAFSQEDYEIASTLLLPLVGKSVCLGGSNPQRRIVEETYLEACSRKDKLSETDHLLQQHAVKT